MSYLFLLMSFFAFSTYALWAQNLLPLHLKRYSFLVSLSLISIVLYVMTFLVSFFQVQYVLYSLSAGYLVYEFKKHKFSRIKDFLQNNQLFFVFSLVWFFLTLGVQILQWDDFSWASFVKHLNLEGSYWTSKAAILEQGLRYFPGLSLWEAFFLGKNLYFEQPLFFAVGLVFVAAFHALVPPDLKSKKFWYYFILFCAPISWFTMGIGNISTETVMGLLLGSALCACLDVKNPKDLVVPFSIAIFLAVVKETGFLLALLVVLLIVVQIIRKKIFLSSWLIFCLACLGVMLVNFQLWQIHLKQDPLLQTFNSSNILSQLQNDLHSLTNRTSDTLTTFFQALYNRPIGRSFVSRLPIPYFQHVKGSYIFWVLLFTAVMIYAKAKAEEFITFFWGLLGYTFVLVITFLYFFGEYEGRILASYERYMGVYFLAFALVCLKYIYDQKLFEHKNFRRALIAMIFVFPPSPRILYPPSLKYLVPESFTKKYSIKVDHNVRLDIAPITEKIKKLTPLHSKIWLIWQHSVGYEAMIVRYEIAPRKMNVFAWTVGTKYDEADVWTVNYSFVDMANSFEANDYVALGFVDENFIKAYGALFVSTPKSGSLYKKELINNNVRWTEIL